MLNIIIPFKKNKLIYTFISFLSIIIVLISGDRASLGLFLLTLLTILILLDKEYITKIQKIVTIFLILIFTFILISSIDNLKRDFIFKL